MKSRTDRKSARGGRALLTGLIRCARFGRRMGVFYGSASDHAHRYYCRDDDSHVGGWLCIGIGGIRIDRAVAVQIVEAVSEHAIEEPGYKSGLQLEDVLRPIPSLRSC
jgi:hypothetical protein